MNEKLKYLSFRLFLCVIAGTVLFTAALAMLWSMCLSLNHGMFFVIVLTILFTGYVYGVYRLIILPYRETKKIYEQFVMGYVINDLFHLRHPFTPEEEQVIFRLNEMIDKNNLINVSKKQAEYLALQNQINPHFLYNTLESINWRAKAVNEEQISAMVEALGSMLRFTLVSQKQPVTLKHELSIVHNYITIQKIRFDDMLSYEEDIPEKFLTLPLPQLTIQPLVENAIHYAMENNDEECLIRIVCQEKRDYISIEIINNGSQFEDDLLDKLASGKISSKGFGIGLLNIQHRFQLTYGNEYGLFLYNLDEDHAVAQIRIPGEDYAKNIDC